LPEVRLPKTHSQRSQYKNSSKDKKTGNGWFFLKGKEIGKLVLLMVLFDLPIITLLC